MTELLAVVIALQFVTLALIAAWAYVAQRRLFILDASAVANRMAIDLLHDYGPDIWRLNQDGVQQYTSVKYMQMVAELGLPSAAVDVVKTAVWEIVATAQGSNQPQPQTVDVTRGNPFYD